MANLFNHDMKHYKAHDGAYLTKTLTWLLMSIIFAAIAYTSEQQYHECLAGNQSVVLCGGGDNK